MRRIAWYVVGVVALVLIFCGSVSAAEAGPPGGLTTGGRALWNFEALLHDTFGSQPVCVDDNLDFSARQCSLGAMSKYSFVFARSRHSAFHLTSSHRQIRQVGHPYPIRVNDHYVACGPRERTFLFGLGQSVNLALGCRGLGG